ncbi:MAG: hypothetical protein QOH12_3032 [Solirubrobacteraceae bacterium]|jgi:hypothetical protein|nr:hypothetical protein [Solirubrobacteraceae bacterium]
MPREHHRLKLTVKSTSGSFTEEFNSENKAEKVLHEAIRRLHLDPNPAVAYVLKRESDGRTLTLSERLGDQGIDNGDIIIVQAGQAQDG